jgi:hypothetical protein
LRTGAGVAVGAAVAAGGLEDGPNVGDGCGVGPAGSVAAAIGDVWGRSEATTAVGLDSSAAEDGKTRTFATARS